MQHGIEVKGVRVGVALEYGHQDLEVSGRRSSAGPCAAVLPSRVLSWSRLENGAPASGAWTRQASVEPRGVLPGPGVRVGAAAHPGSPLSWGLSPELSRVTRARGRRAL